MLWESFLKADSVALFELAAVKNLIERVKPIRYASVGFNPSVWQTVPQLMADNTTYNRNTKSNGTA